MIQWSCHGISCDFFLMWHRIFHALGSCIYPWYCHLSPKNGLDGSVWWEMRCWIGGRRDWVSEEWNVWDTATSARKYWLNLADVSGVSELDESNDPVVSSSWNSCCRAICAENWWWSDSKSSVSPKKTWMTLRMENPVPLILTTTPRGPQFS